MRADPRDERLLEYIGELEASLEPGTRPLLPPLSEADALLRLRGIREIKLGDLWTVAPDERCPAGVPALLLIAKQTSDGLLLARPVSLELALATDKELILPANLTPARAPLVLFGEEHYCRRGALRSPLGTLSEEAIERINAFFDEDVRTRPLRATAVSDSIDGIPLLRLGERQLDDSKSDEDDLLTGLPIEDEDDLRLDARALFLEALHYLEPVHDRGVYVGSLERLLVIQSSRRGAMESGSERALQSARRLFEFNEAVGGLAANAHRDASKERDPMDSLPTVPIEGRLGEVDFHGEIQSDGRWMSIQIVTLRSIDAAPVKGARARLEVHVNGEVLYDRERTTGAQGAIVAFFVDDDEACDYRLTLRYGDEEVSFEW